MRRLLCLLLVISLSTTLVNAQIIPGCPPCFINEEPFDYYPFRPDGRADLRIAINATAMTSAQATKVTSGIVAASAVWNSANAFNGIDTIPYWFNDWSDKNTADFVVQFGIPVRRLCRY